MGLFGRAQTPSEDSGLRDRVNDLISQVTELRGRVQSVEMEWQDMRVQIRKGYQRLEKAAQRAEPKPEPEDTPDRGEPLDGLPGARGFANKLHLLKGRM